MFGVLFAQTDGNGDEHEDGDDDDDGGKDDDYDYGDRAEDDGHCVLPAG